MRTLNRKPGKFTHTEPDYNITIEKFNELKEKLEGLKKARPRLAEEVKRLALMGDFSENFAYQMAKGKLRGVNNGILKIKEILKRAKIIEPEKNADMVQLGHFVTVEAMHETNPPSPSTSTKISARQRNITARRGRTYQILGSSETNPSTGVISHKSPLGSALMNKQVGDIVEIKLDDRVVEYKIIKIK